jgi:hypothetical protein
VNDELSLCRGECGGGAVAAPAHRRRRRQRLRGRVQVRDRANVRERARERERIRDRDGDIERQRESESERERERVEGDGFRGGVEGPISSDSRQSGLKSGPCYKVKQDKTVEWFPFRSDTNVSTSSYFIWR